MDNGARASARLNANRPNNDESAADMDTFKRTKVRAPLFMRCVVILAFHPIRVILNTVEAVRFFEIFCAAKSWKIPNALELGLATK
jgi:hypothetical protein